MSHWLGVTLALAIAFASRADAHWSASRGGSIYTQRYLICNERPQTKVHCAGPIRARGELLAALAGRDVDRAHDAAIDAVYFNVTDAIDPLRALLGHKDNGLRAQAAYALAHLDDVRSAPAIKDLVVEFETRGHGFLWEDTLAALAQLDARAGSTYAIDFLGRAVDFRTSMPGGGSKLRALDHIRREDAATAAPVIARLAKREENGYDHAHCEFMAMRVRLDPAFHADVRRQFAKSYSGSWLAGCANSVLARWVPVPEDAEILVRHLGRPDNGTDFGVTILAYQRIIELLATAGANPTIRRGLLERAKWPYLAHPHMRALHEAALAGAGEKSRLLAIIDDPADRSGTAWLAAFWALRLGLPDARDHVAALMARGIAYSNSERSGIYSDLRARVLEQFATRFPDDARWTVMLLDGDVNLVGTPGNAAEKALYRLARKAPRDTCTVVADASRAARTELAEHAFLSFTVLGDRCRPELRRVNDDSKATPEVRGAALEILGVLGDPELPDRIRRAKQQGVWQPAIDRARKWERRR